MGIIVQKYGGSSVATAEKIKRAARRIAWRYHQGQQLVVVVSAQGDTTDDLLEKAGQISGNPNAREMDVLLASGEQVSMALMAMALGELKIPAVSLTGGQAGILTDDNHRAAKIRTVEPSRVEAELAAGKVVIVAGFQGLTPGGDIATLGRGGSDATAIALAAALDAEECLIFTDVDGVYTADPRLVPSARRLDEITFDEMMELAAAGAQVMQLRSVELAKQFGRSFVVLSSLAPLPEEGGEERGTRVLPRLEADRDRLLSGVALDRNTARLTVRNVPDRPGNAARLFGALGRARVNVDCIVQSGGPGSVAQDISFTTNKGEMEQAIMVVREFTRETGGSDLVYDLDLAKVSVVGTGLATQYGVAAIMFQALAEKGINLELITGSEIKISCLVRSAHAVEAVRAVHDKFNLGGNGVEIDAVLAQAGGGGE